MSYRTALRKTIIKVYKDNETREVLWKSCFQQSSKPDGYVREESYCAMNPTVSESVYFYALMNNRSKHTSDQVLL